MLGAIILATVLSAACPALTGADTCLIRNQSIVTKYVGTAFVVHWAANCPPCPEGNVTSYELDAVEAKLVEPVTPTPILHVVLPASQFSYSWAPLRAGLYYVRVRACYATGCSRWVNSWDPLDTGLDPTPRGFLLQAVLAPATGGGTR